MGAGAGRDLGSPRHPAGAVGPGSVRCLHDRHAARRNAVPGTPPGSVRCLHGRHAGRDAVVGLSAAGRVPPEPGRLDGPWPGVQSCDRRRLDLGRRSLHSLVHLAAGRRRRGPECPRHSAMGAAGHVDQPGGRRADPPRTPSVIPAPPPSFLRTQESSWEASASAGLPCAGWRDHAGCAWPPRCTTDCYGLSSSVWSGGDSAPACAGQILRVTSSAMR